MAFGATRRAGAQAHEDPQVRALLDSRAPVVTLVAKSDRRHVERALRTTVEENCAMVADTVRFLTGEGRRVFVDAEHFFDGYAFDPDASLRVLEAAITAGADVAVLFLGLPPVAESEGYDRTDLDLPAAQLELLHAVAAVQDRIVVVLAGGSVVTVDPWQEEVSALLHGWLPGQAGGAA